ncbi:CoA transferase [Nocardioides sp. AE5]|uniref:CoA transferase n=1 Tax=Nocardioides sp. AE5 TaxID=2962573 RepID=UPI00288271F7|nr:CoA transferase [Nocardioides sp. AE5]MDT0202708.1 CoA transferase [Nocardioides sp. AE5]
MSSAEDPLATPLRAWAASGAMALTGTYAGPPRAAPGDPAGQVARDLAQLRRLGTELTGRTPDLPGVSVLSERAALAGFHRNAPWSCGGAFRFLPSTDGFFGLSLPRLTDVELVPALTGDDALAGQLDARPDAVDLAWQAAAEWARGTTATAALERARLLGLACATAPAGPEHAGPEHVEPDHVGPERPATLWEAHRLPSGSWPSRPLVLDLTALWAGPLAGHLLHRLGATVVKVESPGRPDGARRGSRAFFDLLHGGHRMVALDLDASADIALLRDLMRRSDLVLEGSRARALRQRGIVAEDIVADGTSWISITARGRASDTVGFGDDVAADAGLITWLDGHPVPCGDAIADPLTGVAAAVAGAQALASPEPSLVEVSMFDVVRRALAAPGPADHDLVRRGGQWWVDDGATLFPVAEPTARVSDGNAAATGADTAVVLRRLGLVPRGAW